MPKKFVTQAEINNWAGIVAELIHLRYINKADVMAYGVPRGGIPALYAIQSAFARYSPGYCLHITEDINKADVIIDDLIDSGATQQRYSEYAVPFYALIDKRHTTDDWIVFPWEVGEEDTSADDIATRLLQYVGEDSERGGLAETPKRFLKAWDHWTSGYGVEPESILKTFEDGAADYDEMVLVKNIPAYSKCEHHLADIFGVAHVAYIPDGKIVGLSKLNRLVDLFGRRLQVQERWTTQVADALMKALQPKGVAVILECRHMCMESRGICQQGHSTTTSAMRGVFKDNIETRAEFLGLIK